MDMLATGGCGFSLCSEFPEVLRGEGWRGKCSRGSSDPCTLSPFLLCILKLAIWKALAPLLLSKMPCRLPLNSTLCLVLTGGSF